MKPTAEQELILEEARSSTSNIIINARAGAAKTTTMVLLTQSLPPVSTLAIAFNKKIAMELGERMPANVKSSTLNALGHGSLRGLLGRYPQVDDKKLYTLLRAEIDLLDQFDQDEAQETFTDTLSVCRTAKNEGYMPGRLHPSAKPLYIDDEFFNQACDLETSPLQRHLVRRVLKKSFEQALAGRIDFADQIYIPAIMPVSFDIYSTVFVDEAQDLSLLNHVLLKKIVKSSRLIAVGDPCQAIYGFRGAHEESMELLRKQFSMKEFFLTICFRSSESVVKNARWRAPDMQWRPGAPLGSVTTLPKWSSSDLRQGDAIICRNNAPLFRAALRLLRAGLFPELSASDVTKSILGTMKKLGKPSIPAAEAELALTAWVEQREKKDKNTSRVHDIAESIRVFLEDAATLADAISRFDQIVSQGGKIKLMTGHKSKGLEFDRVFFLDRDLCKKGKDQDNNVRYVIETRARESLFYVESEGWTA